MSRKLSPVINPLYYTMNPPQHITVNGKQYNIHMTFTNRSEAYEEARDLKDHGKKTSVQFWHGGYAVYERD